MADTVRALFLGDIVGQPGSRAIFVYLQDLKKKYSIDFTAANGENAADGFGITPELANQFYSAGIDVITTGNHIWQKREILDMLKNDARLLRPANYPSSVPGKGTGVFEVKGVQVAVVNLQGRNRLQSSNCPFKQAMDSHRSLKSAANILIIDFHAEAPDEKESLALYMDGKASLIVGTHTHVQTADERILPRGTGYITDLGMTGPVPSVIGFNPAIAVQRNLTQMPLKMEVADAPAVLQGVVAEIDAVSGKTLDIFRINEHAGL
jgi:2',3'-cyclic-nucleotide 2'-phosphodiesterase